MKKKRIGVVLAGCGVYDGAEIQEAVLTLLALDEGGAEAVCLAPDIDQYHVINHRTGETAENESRNVLTEAARIARGKIQAIDTVDLTTLDGAVFPGGFGAAKNLCTFALEGPDASIEPATEAFIRSMHAAKKPLGFACISPALCAKALGTHHPELTIGSDPEVASGLETLGARHHPQVVTAIHRDVDQRIVSTPAYMCDATIGDVSIGIRKMVEQVLDWT